MVMVENEGNGGPPRSPWKTQPVAVMADAAEVLPLIGDTSDSWPELSNLQRPRTTDTTVKSPSCPVADDAAPQPTQESAEPPQKSHAHGNPNLSHGHGNPDPSYKHSPRQQKAGTKRNPNRVPPFHVPLPYHPSAIPPAYNSMVPWPHIPVPGYAYQPFPGSFPSVETHIVNSGCESPMPAFVPPVSGSIQPPPRGDPNTSVNFSNRRPNMQGGGAHFNPAWHNQRAFGSKENIDVQQSIGPRTFIRPPFFGPVPGFVGGPTFPGAPGSIYYLPAVPPLPIRVPHPPYLLPHPSSSGTSVLPSQTLALRANITKQIEYYFSDENLQSDHYLLSLMDAHGWVPISTIANFKRVKRMSTDIPFIVDALQGSITVEVQGDNVRRRDEWSKWIPASTKNKLSSEAVNPLGQPAENVINDMTNNTCGEDNMRVNSEGTDEFASKKDRLVTESLSVDINGDHSMDKVLIDCGIQACDGIKGDLNVKLNCKSSIMSLDIGNTHASPSPDCLEGRTAKSMDRESPENESIGVPSNLTVQNLDKVCNDFASTFMFDEELEHEQIKIKKDSFSSRTSVTCPRMDEEDDEMVVNDQAVERLVIVTQNSRTGEGSKSIVKESESFSSELASAINDGLYYYEQELKAKRTNSRRNSSTKEIRDGNSKSSGTAGSMANQKAAGVSCYDGPGNSNSRRKQNKGFSKQQSIIKQRLFSSNLKNHGSGLNSFGIISESPPSNSVGFFFGSTPPDNHG